MSVKETRALREKSTGELEDELQKMRKECLGIRMRAPTDEGIDPHKLRRHRRRIARIMTLLGERVRAAKGKV